MFGRCANWIWNLRIENKRESIDNWKFEMDVIDLCDDDNDMVELNSSSRRSSISLPPVPIYKNYCNVEMKEEKYTPTPNKPVLKVVAIEKLTNSSESNAKATTAKRTSRRKSVLQPKVHDNDSIQFLDESSESEIIVADAEPNERMVDDMNELLMNLDNEANPNIEAMRRVAFLRVSIQHTLKELGLSPVKFDRSGSWGNLRAQYMQNKKNRDKKGSDSNWTLLKHIEPSESRPSACLNMHEKNIVGQFDCRQTASPNDISIYRQTCDSTSYK